MTDTKPTEVTTPEAPEVETPVPVEAPSPEEKPSEEQAPEAEAPKAV